MYNLRKKKLNNFVLGTYLEARKFAEENSEASSLDNLYEDTRKKKFKHSKTLRNDQISSPPKLQSDGNNLQ